MNSAPVSIRRLLMPLKTAVATKARRHAPSAAASSELAGCCCAGARAEFIKTAYHCYGHETTLGLVKTGGQLSWLVAGHLPGDDNGPNIPGFLEIWAGSRPGR